MTLQCQAHGCCAQAGSQPAVKGRGAAAALQVSQNGDTRFNGALFLKILPHPHANAAQAAKVDIIPGNGVDLVLTQRPGAFGHGEDGEVGAAQGTGTYFGGDRFKFKRDFRNEDDICAPGHAGVEGDEAGVAPHDFQHHGTVVGLGRGMQAVKGFRGDAEGGVKAKSEFGDADVVVDGFGHADHGHTQVMQLAGDTQGAVAADHDQTIQIEGANAFNQQAGDIFNDGFTIPDHFAGKGVAAVGRAEDGAAARQNALHLLKAERKDALGG